MAASTTRAVWRLTTHHEHPEAAYDWIIRTNRIALGWGQIGDTRAAGYASVEQIADAIREAFPGLPNAARGGGSLYDFCHALKLDDLVILSVKGSRKSVVSVVGEYQHLTPAAAMPDTNYWHAREVQPTTLNADTLWDEVGGIGSADRYRPLVRLGELAR